MTPPEVIQEIQQCINGRDGWGSAQANLHVANSCLLLFANSLHQRSQVVRMAGMDSKPLASMLQTRPHITPPKCWNPTWPFRRGWIDWLHYYSSDRLPRWLFPSNERSWSWSSSKSEPGMKTLLLRWEYMRAWHHAQMIGELYITDYHVMAIQFVRKLHYVCLIAYKL